MTCRRAYWGPPRSGATATLRQSSCPGRSTPLGKQVGAELAPHGPTRLALVRRSRTVGIRPADPPGLQQRLQVLPPKMGAMRHARALHQLLQRTRYLVNASTMERCRAVSRIPAWSPSMSPPTW